MAKGAWRSDWQEVADRVAALEDLVHHLRRCRECGESDVENCFDGKQLWNAAMPQDQLNE